MPDVWNPDFASLHPALQTLPATQGWSGYSDWPDCANLTARLPAGMLVDGKHAIHFLPQDDILPFPELYYEQRIWQHGIVSTRANWHDFFNALIWSSFPRSKLMINARHVADMQKLPDKRRTPQRDALTVLDESGVLVVSSQRGLLEAIRGFDWQQVFVTQCEAWGQTADCFLFGHAMMEKLLTPYVGMTAHALLIEVDEAFFRQERAQLDGLIAHTLAEDGLLSPLCMNPLPLLGIPGWWSGQDAGFYANTDYFRGKSRERQVDILHGC